MTLDINYTTTNPRNVDKILEASMVYKMQLVQAPMERGRDQNSLVVSILK